MNRYVDAAAVRAAIVKAREAALEHKPYGWEWENNGYNGAILAAGRVPAADVRPVKRGKWERRLDTRFGPKLNDIIICSNCKVAFSTEDTLRRSFCPNCGADMRPPEVDENA